MRGRWKKQQLSLDDLTKRVYCPKGQSYCGVAEKMAQIPARQSYVTCRLDTWHRLGYKILHGERSNLSVLLIRLRRSNEYLQVHEKYRSFASIRGAPARTIGSDG